MVQTFAVGEYFLMSVYSYIFMNHIVLEHFVYYLCYCGIV